jgi:hypothetical protein
MASKDSSNSQSQDKDAKKSKGQQRSTERGSATNNKKNPGKRAKQGGSSR